MQKSDTPPSSVSFRLTFQSIRRQRDAIARQPLLMLSLLSLLGLGLRLYKLTYWNYWDDEIISTFAARAAPMDVLFSIVDYSVHPPFYYFVLHFWMILGDDLYMIRLLSVLISTACIPLMYVLGREIMHKPGALVAAAIMTIAPFQIFHGQQARMYPLLTLLVLATAYFFLRTWRHGTWTNRVGLGLCVVCGLYTHVYFSFSLLGLNLWALYETYHQRRIDYRRWVDILIIQSLAVLAFLPFVPQLFRTVSGVVQWYWIGGTTAFDWLFALLSISNYATLAQESSRPVWYLAATYTAGVAVVVLTLVYSLREMRQQPVERSGWGFLHLLLWTPIVVATVISLTIKPILLDRSLIGVSAPLYLLMGWLFVRYWQVRVVQFVALFFGVSCLASLGYAYPDTPRENSLIRMADYLAAEQQADDAIAFADWQAFDTTFLIHPDLENVYVLAAPTVSRVQFAGRDEWLARLSYMNWPYLENVQPVAKFGPHHQRVWLVLTNHTYTIEYQREVNQAWLETHGRLVEEKDFNRARVFLYEIEPQE
jgi:uncharacterized membrane protein